MSSDSSEVRVSSAEPLNRVMVSLLILMLGIFLLQWIVPPFNRFAIKYLAFNTADFIGKFRLWQAVTSIFLHADISHFLGNMIFFWFFGSALANAWQRREFFTYFFVCGIAGSLCYYLFDLIRGVETVGLGASGGIFGLMAAYAMTFGERMVLAFFLIPMKAKYFVGICFAIEVLMLLRGGSGIGHVAHLGGALAGFIYLKIAWRQKLFAAKHQPLASRISGLEPMDNDD